MARNSSVAGDFPILSREVNGTRLVYLDSAATAQKPSVVLEAMDEYYRRHNANVHRGAHVLGDEATGLLERSRKRVAEFIGASDYREVVFVRNATEALNLVAYAWGLENLGDGDVVLVTEMEHHANVVPWQKIAEMRSARVEFVRVDGSGLLDMDDLRNKLSDSVKVLSFTHVSNTLGTVNPVKEIVEMGREVGALVVVDGAQAVPHMRVNVEDIGCDFYAFSGHKVYGPMGIGVLWGRKEILDGMRPFLMGGGMISEVYKDRVVWADVPEKFEAGTPNVAGAVGLMTAMDYLDGLGMDWVEKHGMDIVKYALERLGELESGGVIDIVGPRDEGVRVGSVSFVYKGVHAHDVATILDGEGVAVRSGHHCTMILHNVLGLSATVRASFGVYTTKDDVDSLVKGLRKVREIFR